MSFLVERITSHVGDVGGIPIQRALPNKGRRTVGAWCFADHAGPATLPPEQRMVIVLRYTQGLSYEEIAAILGCSTGTIASRLNRVHKVLERRLSRLAGERGGDRV